METKYGRAPTGRQVSFARAISAALGIALPELWTRQSLFLFIRDNRPRFERNRTFGMLSLDVDPSTGGAGG